MPCDDFDRAHADGDALREIRLGLTCDRCTTPNDRIAPNHRLVPHAGADGIHKCRTARGKIERVPHTVFAPNASRPTLIHVETPR